MLGWKSPSGGSGHFEINGKRVKTNAEEHWVSPYARDFLGPLDGPLVEGFCGVEREQRVSDLCFERQPYENEPAVQVELDVILPWEQ